MLQTTRNKELIIVGGPNGSGKTTLAGKSLSNIIRRSQDELGYTMSIVFIFLDSEEVCIERIQTRVRKGGYPVPEKDVIRRFGRSIVNFWNEYQEICDRWVLYYNTEDSFRQVAYQQHQEIYVYDLNCSYRLMTFVPAAGPPPTTPESSFGVRWASLLFSLPSGRSCCTL